MTAIAKIGARYENLKSRNVACYLIDHDILSLFFQEKGAVDPQLKAAAENDKYALSLKVLLNYLAFEYANCPLPLSHPYYYRDGRAEKISHLLDLLSEAYPIQAPKLQAIKGAIKMLRGCDDNPLLENIENTVGFNDATLILINPDYTHAVSDMCESYGIDLKINVPGAENLSTKKGVFCGCAKYFPQHVFWAPEYPELYLIRYAWFHDYIRPFNEPHGQISKPKVPSPAIHQRPPTYYEEPESGAAAPADDINLALFEQYTDRVSADVSADIIEAKVVILKGGKFVFLPAEESYSHHCLVNLDGDPIPKKLQISAFDENTAILLKERGEGDYVVEMADQVLRGKAQYFRAQQQKWKKALRDTVDAWGINTVSEVLKNSGCATAHIYNLRNWLSPRHIRPESDADFTRLLQYVELGNEAKELIKCMDIIRSAHVTGGHRISEQLRTLIQQDGNLKSILTDGYRIYRLGDNGRKLGVYIFDQVLSKTVIVGYAEIGQLKSVEALYG